MAQFGTHVDEDLQLLDNKIKQLRNEYEQYFLGSRKREPYLLRQEVTKMVAYYANVPITNTGHRFRFNNLRARFFTLRRYWDVTLRKIDEGRYERHIFKAELHERERRKDPEGASPAEDARAPAEGEDLFARYVAARESCGQGSGGLTREKLQAILDEQAAALRARFGCQEVRFRVVVEDGRAKVRASPVRG